MTSMISVIVSTYNRPDALRMVLNALCHQTDNNFEIIVADDGSDYKTKQVVDQYLKNNKVSIRHVWQPDEGFRLARIRNLAVKESIGKYIIFLDGDCIPPTDFIGNHRKLAESGWAVIGQRILCSQSFTRELLEKKFEWSEGKGQTIINLTLLNLRNKINRLAPAFRLPLGSLRKKNPNNWEKVRGCNWAMWKRDYAMINGSDEAFEGWGAEDKDVAVRLINAGIKLKDGRLYSHVFHLWHPIASRENEKRNVSLVKERILSKTIYPIKGMY